VNLRKDHYRVSLLVARRTANQVHSYNSYGQPSREPERLANNRHSAVDSVESVAGYLCQSVRVGESGVRSVERSNTRRRFKELARCRPARYFHHYHI